jgi:crotonobetainyl-CoA:carnitine CoA-transferase CaiB-like acyl-CoA transferase
MYEICVQQMRDALLAAQRSSRPLRTGNEDVRVFHQDVYPTLGEDRWIAITCHSAAQWTRLCQLANLRATEPGKATNALRQWTGAQHERELAEHLQAAGIAAAPVQDIEDLIEHDPQLASRGALLTLDHAVLGAFGHMRTPLTFSRSRIEPFRAPSLGEHSREIATTLCGLSAERIAALEALGVFQ